MGFPTRGLILALLAVLAGALAAANASANTITAEPAGAITKTSLGRVTFAARGGIEIAINCNMTLRGSINTTISNAAGGSFGSIVEGRLSECNVGSMAFLVEAGSPWPITLSEASRLERAPNVISLVLGGFKFQLSGIFGQSCLYEGNVPLEFEAEGPAEALVTRLMRIRANSLRVVRNSGLCPERGELRGQFSFTTQTIRL